MSRVLLSRRGWADSTRAPFADLLLALLVLLAVESVLFHGRLYLRWIEPFSSSGRVEMDARRFAIARSNFPERRLVVFMGNSTVGSGVSEDVLEWELGVRGVPWGVFNMAQGGSSPRAWRFLLRRASLEPRTAALVVLGVSPPAVAAVQEHADRTDLEIVKSRVDVHDLPALLGSYPGVEWRLHLVVGILFQSVLYRADLRDLLERPGHRRQALARSAWVERSQRRGARRSNRSKKSLASVRRAPRGGIDAARAAPWIRADPGTLELLGRLIARHDLWGRLPDAPIRLDPVHRRALATTVRELDDRGIPVALTVVPPTGFPRSCYGAGDLDDLVAELRSEGRRVFLMDTTRFLPEIQSPELFGDPQHLNGDGSALLSRELARRIANLAPTLAGPP